MIDTLVEIDLIIFYPMHAADGKCSNVTGLQLPGVLDDLFAYNGPLGAIFSDRSITLNLWAPTAQVCFFITSLICLNAVSINFSY